MLYELSTVVIGCMIALILADWIRYTRMKRIQVKIMKGIRKEDDQ